MAWSLDTSAFLKLAVMEERSTELRRWVDAEEEHGPLWSCDLLHTEAIRAARRVGPAALAAVRDLLDRIAILALTPETLARAGELDPAVMRALWPAGRAEGSPPGPGASLTSGRTSDRSWDGCGPRARHGTFACTA